MALDINGYNDTFKAFVDFAQEKAAQNNKKAVARGTLENGELAGRQITASDTDSVHKWRRSETDKTANDRTRDIFKASVIDMFGGEAHALQAQIVGACLSQSANGPLKGGLASYGLYASEHAALDYSLSKDDETGAVTIRYSSPSRLPVSFSWTCTVNVDGSCTTTPLTVNADMRPIGNISEKMARGMVADSIGKLGLEDQIDGGKIEQAKNLLREHGRVGVHAEQDPRACECS